ncbi:cbb3-type cytochrome c oxidase subunit 3 [uncultured Sulfitobacter sp.]|uniref:cbb3-type cytochrome c oxidase subunit 3 n=1 Tax=uncultured Sulfitobacter sp. TaxID=191468 RepID=UPI00261D8E46|nr:cbb3-type cytochrome c oxidase subunit 3 [uncultured Sulfitobacter sp.]
MDTYSLLREIADSWGLLAMFLFFLAVAFWAFMPSQSNARKEASMIPFKDYETDAKKSSCAGTCDACKGKNAAQKKEGLSDE